MAVYEVSGLAAQVRLSAATARSVRNIIIRAAMPINVLTGRTVLEGSLRLDVLPDLARNGVTNRVTE